MVLKVQFKSKAYIFPVCRPSPLNLCKTREQTMSNKIFKKLEIWGRAQSEFARGHKSNCAGN